MEHSVVGYVLVSIVLFILAADRLSRPREKVVGNMTFSDVSILPDGIYETLFEIPVRHVVVCHVNTTTRYSKMYAVHIDGMPRNEDGTCVEHFIKEKGSILP